MPLLGVPSGTATLQNSWASSGKGGTLPSPAFPRDLSRDMPKNVWGSLVGDSKNKQTKATVK